MLILALDLGLHTTTCAGTGWARISVKRPTPPELLDYGVLRAQHELTDKNFGGLLERLNVELKKLAEPCNIITWEWAMGANRKYIHQHGMLSGVVLGVANDLRIDVEAIPTSTWKRLVVGYGNAGKREVRQSVFRLCKLDGLEAAEQDTLDAIAIGMAWVAQDYHNRGLDWQPEHFDHTGPSSEQELAWKRLHRNPKKRRRDEEPPDPETDGRAALDL